MERRVLLAIVLMTLVVVGTNLLFPPAAPPPRGAGNDTAGVEEAAGPPEGTENGGDGPGAALPGDTDRAGGRAGAGEGREEGEEEADRERPLFGADTTRRAVSGDTVRVRTPLFTLRFDTRGAALTGIELNEYASYSEEGRGRRAQLVREGDRWLTWRITAGGADTLDLGDRIFETSGRRIDLGPDAEERRLTFVDSLPQYPNLRFRVTYTFSPREYAIGVEGGLEGIGRQGYTVLTGLGRGLETNEVNAGEDFDQLALVVNGESGGIRNFKLDDVEPDEVRAAEGGPFRWVAVKNKYFLASLVAPEEGTRFGGALARGLAEEHAAEMYAAMPVPAGEEGFRFRAYLGPQEFDRLRAVGQELQNVNPYGWEWLRFIIRPLVGIITSLLTWLHSTLSLAYGWVLILFGVMMRVVLFPLYQKSMRAQMQQMQVQPILKEIQSKYEDDPEKLQKEMMRVYREHNLNPLAGCLPMLVPFPVLITLFFVFQNTIEFRGVPFLWLPDLSRADPYYIIPLLMGASMFLLQWIGQKGMERNTQMKLMSYGMPVVFTLLFLRFPAGLNLYYATSNLASLPQQLYLSKERQKMQQKKGGPSEEADAD